MTVAQRIYRDTMRTTWNSEQERVQREQLGRQRNSAEQASRDLEVLHEVSEANNQLHRKNASLQQENEELKQRLSEQEQHAADVLRQVADRSETWRRTMDHFRKAWGGMLPSVPSDEDTVCETAVAKGEEVRADPEWQEQREAYIQSTLKPRSRGNGRKART